MLIGLRMRGGDSLDLSRLRELPFYQVYGDLRDALIFTGATFIMVLALFASSTLDAWDQGEFLLKSARLWLPLPFAFMIGYFVPTWYRVARARRKSQAAESQFAAEIVK